MDARGAERKKKVKRQRSMVFQVKIVVSDMRVRDEK